ncbi:hypothetical protein J4P02_23405 [Pseudomonas sp. NFXW11]|uniref:hypothetical protein n=1 Tax=Pseudomonas sp. NFXW11 TaxID=2819531 RepID=UPI003CF94E93
MLFRYGNPLRSLAHRRHSPRHRAEAKAIFTCAGEALSSRYAVVIALSIGSAHAAHGEGASLDVAQEHAPLEQQNSALQVTPYIWAARLDGRVSPFQRGPTISVEKPFSEVVDDLNLGGFINVWGRYERFVLSGDIMYVDTTDIHKVGPLPAFSIPGLGVIPPGGNVDAKVDTKQFTATLMGGYRVIDAPGFSLDALAGARVWHISNRVKVTGSLGGLSKSASYHESFGWVDPLVGLRAFLPITQKLSVQGQADIGGFGAGSNFTWSTLVSVNYAFRDSLSTSVGYKLLDVDYDHNGHVYDTRLSGPALGMTYRF